MSRTQKDRLAIGEFKIARKAFQSNVEAYINAELQSFYSKTGVNIDKIRVPLCDSFCQAKLKQPKHKVLHISIRTDLEL